jgi:hypothetical protein
MQVDKITLQEVLNVLDFETLMQSDNVPEVIKGFMRDKILAGEIGEMCEKELGNRSCWRYNKELLRNNLCKSRVIKTNSKIHVVISYFLSRWFSYCIHMTEQEAKKDEGNQTDREWSVIVVYQDDPLFGDFLNHIQTMGQLRLDQVKCRIKVLTRSQIQAIRGFQLADECESMWLMINSPNVPICDNLLTRITRFKHPNVERFVDASYFVPEVVKPAYKKRPYNAIQYDSLPASNDHQQFSVKKKIESEAEIKKRQKLDEFSKSYQKLDKFFGSSPNKAVAIEQVVVDAVMDEKEENESSNKEVDNDDDDEAPIMTYNQILYSEKYMISYDKFSYGNIMAIEKCASVKYFIASSILSHESRSYILPQVNASYNKVLQSISDIFVNISSPQCNHITTIPNKNFVDAVHKRWNDYLSGHPHLDITNITIQSGLSFKYGSTDASFICSRCTFNHFLK